MRVTRLFTRIDGVLIEEAQLPRKGGLLLGDAVGLLTNLLPPSADAAPDWSIQIMLGEGYDTHAVVLAIEPFLTPAEYAESQLRPLSFADLLSAKNYSPKTPSPAKLPPRWLWIFRDAIYITERNPGLSEIDEVVLRIKSQQYQRDESLKRLREQVANFEAVERTQSDAAERRPLPDDVKMLVWSRDGGVCVRCGAAKDLHFDHIIPLSRGGGDHSENIQLLCRTCNLSKGSRLA